MKKIIFAIAVLATTIVMAAAPTCTVEKETWGRQYLKLTDVNGKSYKIQMPAAGRTIRFVTKTGWYELNADGKILRYQDPK